MAGGVNLFGSAGQHAPWLEWRQLVDSDPDVILILPCGFDLTRTRQDLPLLTGKPEWAGLRAVVKGRVYLLDGNQYFNRPGPRLVESLEILAEVLHPDADPDSDSDVLHFGHEGSGWQRWEGIGKVGRSFRD
jgi:iron complex transport system substrate-binding protein